MTALNSFFIGLLQWSGTEEFGQPHVFLKSLIPVAVYGPCRTDQFAKGAPRPHITGIALGTISRRIDGEVDITHETILFTDAAFGIEKLLLVVEDLIFRVNESCSFLFLIHVLSKNLWWINAETGHSPYYRHYCDDHYGNIVHPRYVEG